MKINRRRFFQSVLSLAAMAAINPLKLIPHTKELPPNPIHLAEGSFDLITLHNLQPQHRYSVKAAHGPVKLSCLDTPVTLEPGQAVVITPTENGGWKLAT